MYVKSHENRQAIDKLGEICAATVTDTGPLSWMYEADFWSVWQWKSRQQALTIVKQNKQYIGQ